MALDYAVMDAACNIIHTAEDDVYYIFDDSLICTKQVDRETVYTLKSDTQIDIHTRNEYCVETVVARSECCTAKLNGMDGEGLENACEA